jgi:hypothetical protein
MDCAPALRRRSGVPLNAGFTTSFAGITPKIQPAPKPPVFVCWENAQYWMCAMLFENIPPPQTLLSSCRSAVLLMNRSFCRMGPVLALSLQAL